MKKKSIIAIVAIVLILIIALISSYNGFVNASEEVNSAKSAVATQLQRRADLIPNFVNTVKGYSDYEKSTFTAVTEARTAVAMANTVDEQAAAEEKLNGAISVWVNAVTEAYPELKANENYIALQDELSGTENRIATARRDYNKVAKEYNLKIKRFPGKILAGLFGFDAAHYFEADEGTSSVPQVTFD